MTRQCSAHVKVGKIEGFVNGGKNNIKRWTRRVINNSGIGECERRKSRRWMLDEKMNKRHWT